MYPNTDAALRQAYKIWAVRIEPMGNTAQVCDWMQSKGVKGGGSGLTQHEHHAHSAMIIARVLLEPAELAVIEMHYTGGQKLDGIIDLTAHIERQNTGANLLLCDSLVSNIFTSRPRQTQIQDRFDLSKGTLWRRRKEIQEIIGALFDAAMQKLEADFQAALIIERKTECTLLTV